MKKPSFLSSFTFAASMLAVISCSSGAENNSASASVLTPLGLVIDTDGDHIPDTDSRIANMQRFAGGYYHGVVLHNCDDDNGDKQVDDQDSIVNGAEDLKDLYPIKVRAAGMDPDDSVIISITGIAEGSVRLFHKEVDGTIVEISLDHEIKIPASTFQSAPMLYIEGVEFASSAWDGNFTVTATDPSSKEEFSTSKINLRVAPWLMLSNASDAEVLYIREHEGRNDRMIEQLETILPGTKTELKVIPASASYPAWNIWMQDTMEIGRQFTLSGSMPVVLQANRNKGLDNFSTDELLGSDFGWMRVGDFREKYGKGDANFEWMDWFGNLEVSPPLPNYPHGRVYYGEAGEGNQLDPRIVSKIDAQGLQDPFSIDVSYLIIKHADETVSWVPGKDGRWYVLVPSPAEMVKLAKKIQADGHGDLPMLTAFEEGYTFNKLLSDGAGIERNMKIENGPLAKNIITLKRELGISDNQIIKVPGFIKSGGASLIPNMVNSALANGTLLVPDPDGPVVNGVDLIEQDFLERMANTSVKIEFIDDQQYHRWLGNVHCATNVKRTGSEQIAPLKN